jgi:D-glycero-D-manno-heptose 1,7-bisphosphate phosphatase
MKNLGVNRCWSIFLDRDGVINEKIENDYVKNWDEFVFTERAIDAIAILSDIFERIIVVTNQRGVGKGLMTEEQLNFIHDKMNDKISENLGKIDKIYFCTDILDSAECRKPNSGLALKAKLDFPELDFAKTIMIGDSISDMIFGKNLGMKCIYINKNLVIKGSIPFDLTFKSLHQSSIYLKENLNQF